MTTRYKFDKNVGLVDIEGKVILQLVAVGCSKSFRNTAGKELANKLNGIEQSKEAVERAKKYFRDCENNGIAPPGTPFELW